MKLRPGVWKWLWWATLASLGVDVGWVMFAISYHFATMGMFWMYLMLLALKGTWLILTTQDQG